MNRPHKLLQNDFVWLGTMETLHSNVFIAFLFILAKSYLYIVLWSILLYPLRWRRPPFIY